METKTYKTQCEGWILGEHRKEGALVRSTTAAAEYAVMNGSLVEHTEDTGKKKVDEVASEGEAEDTVQVIPSNSPEASADTSASSSPSATRRR